VILHRHATRWLAQDLDHGWATCPIPESGVVRVMALAMHHGGTFVSCDQRISLDGVPGASASHLCVISSD
jgi:hypothetical protein